MINLFSFYYVASAKGSRPGQESGSERSKVLGKSLGKELLSKGSSDGFGSVPWRAPQRPILLGSGPNYGWEFLRVLNCFPRREC